MKLPYTTFLIMVWVAIQVIIAILIIFLIIYIRITVPVNKIYDKIEHLDQSKLKTGDLLAVSYRAIQGSMINAISGCEWCHCGIIYIDSNNIIYVLEGSRYDYNKPDFLKIPLSKWLNINKRGKICLMKINKPVNNLYQTFKPFIDNSSLEGFNLGWIRFLQTKKYNKKFIHNRRMTCVEACIRTLQECGVFQRKYSESSYLLQNILRGQIKSVNGFSYSKPTFLIQNNYNL